MPIVVFQANSSVATASDQQQQSPVQKKRRRQSDASASSSSNNSSLYFFMLTKAVGGGSSCALQFINRVDLQVESHQPASSQADLVGEVSLLQVQITDGPHVVVHQPMARELSILKLGRQDARFFVWGAGLNIQTPAGNPSRLRSCVFVGEGTSDSPHLLLQFASTGNGDDADGLVVCQCCWWPCCIVMLPLTYSHVCRASGCHWMVCGLSEATTTNAALTTCSYIFKPSGDASVTTTDEQVTCCAMLSRGAQAWSSGSALDMWQTSLTSPAANSPHQPIDVAQGTLVVTGTTRNTLYVHDCGILLLSFVLPTTPSEM